MTRKTKQNPRTAALIEMIEALDRNTGIGTMTTRVLCIDATARELENVHRELVGPFAKGKKKADIAYGLADWLLLTAPYAVEVEAEACPGCPDSGRLRRPADPDGYCHECRITVDAQGADDFQPAAKVPPVVAMHIAAHKEAQAKDATGDKNGKAKKAKAPKPPKARDSRLPAPGTVLTRRYKGKDYQATITSGDEVLVGGAEFKNLRAAATAITGSRTNGINFFGLGKQVARPAGIKARTLGLLRELAAFDGLGSPEAMGSLVERAQALVTELDK